MDIIKYYEELRFEPIGYFAFSASEELVYFDEEELANNEGRLALLHEVSHALLGHFTYSTDFELLAMETQAWHKTQLLCEHFGVAMNKGYVEECIATYDHWLVSRSTCPKCSNFCLARSEESYRCFMCGCEWVASSDRHSRVKLSIVS